ncbi:hypothetical protein B0T18DRAFT_428246 [Schizothecium vesticola]|uniref:WSC domain-containing protein n=1 Tax=Schizothecium vesticola TaxID=314040 RepID=A0AA40K913_9PEZI|nr:hypothetical protein B0T18DRAFT_428246 [Schizothecium vesticola]
MLSIQYLGLALLAATGAVAITNQAEKPQLNVETTYGCYNNKGDLVTQGTNIYNSKGGCATETCKPLNYTVAATMGGNECYCGFNYPSKKNKIDDSECDIPCVGYPLLEACGGIMKWTVYNTGLTLAVVAVDEAAPTAVGSGSDAESTKPAPTAAQTTVLVTPPPKEEKSTNTGAVAGGVVVGVLAVASVIGGILFYLRRKRNREIEEEHHRNAVNSFTGKTPSITDSRLDPVMAQRRMSDGSIADNHDYSRKILRVTNA